MAESNPSVTIIQYSSSRDGSAFSGLLLANGLREAGMRTSVIFGNDGPMLAEYRAAGHDVHVCHHRSWLRHGDVLRFIGDVTTEWKHAAAIASRLSAVDANLVYINTSVSLAGLIAARRLDLPVVWHLRELFADVGGEMRVPSVLKPYIRGTFARFAAGIAVPSRIIAKNMLGGDADQAVVIPNAAGAEFFECRLTRTEARRRLGLPLKPAIVGLPGMLRPMKGHTFFLRAIAPLLNECDDLLVALTGSGKDRYESRLTAEAAELGITGKVRFLGVLEEMPAFYRSCDVTVVPSRNEPFGRTIIESMAVGSPVVASRVGGIPEIIQHEETGLLFDYGDQEALLSCVRHMLNDETASARIVNRARERAVDEYHEATYKRRVADLVSGVLRSLS